METFNRKLTNSRLIQHAKFENATTRTIIRDRLLCIGYVLQIVLFRNTQIL